MILRQVKCYKDRLQQENYKSFYLAFLRVAISAWLLKEVCINWPGMDILYGQSVFIPFKNTFFKLLPNGLSFLRGHYMWFIVPYIIVISINLFGIGRWVTALLVFFMTYVLQQMNRPITTGGDIMARLILFYLIFADSYQYFVLIKQKYVDRDKRGFQNLLSNLAAFSIMLQLCLAYFATGLAKINNPLWWNGEAVYYALSIERFIGTPLNKYIVQYKWIDIAANYAILLFELLFPFLIWIKKLRKPLLISGLIFHLCIYIFLMIYGFQIVFLLIYGLFLPNDKLLNVAQKIKSVLRFNGLNDDRINAVKS